MTAREFFELNPSFKNLDEKLRTTVLSTIELLEEDPRGALRMATKVMSSEKMPKTQGEVYTYFLGILSGFAAANMPPFGSDPS